MRSRGMGYAALTAGVALGLWLWTLPARDGAPAGGHAGPSSAPRPGSELEAAGNSRTLMEADETAVPGGRRAATTPPDADALCRIRVVRAGSGAPEPEATLWLQRDDTEWSGPEWKALMTRFNDAEPVLASGMGREVELDAEGEARVPVPARKLSLAAAHGEWHGEATLEAGQRECVVELSLQHTLVIEVVDRAGRPVADASVVLCWGAFDPIEQRWPWRTDAEGRVTIVKVEHQLWPAGHTGPLRLSMGGGVTSEPEAVAFSFEDMPANPVRFVLGEHGSLRVQMVDRNGSDLDPGGYASLWRSLAGLREITLSDRAGADLDARLVSGSARFDGLGLGCFFEISAGAEGHLDVWTEVAGPTRPGEALVVRIPLGAPRIKARGHLSGLAALFGPDVSASALLTGDHPWYPGSQNPGFQTWVGEGGAFEARMWASAQVEGEQGDLQKPWDLTLEREGGPRLHVSAVPTYDERAAVLDFGEIVLESVSWLARVHVVDESGRGIARATIETRSRSVERLSCDEEGWCRLAGPPASLPLMLRATSPARIAGTWTPIVRPGSELTLVLERGARLEGRLILPEGTDPEAFELALRATGSGATETRTVTPVHDGRFLFEGCPAGRFVLQVTYLGDDVAEPIDFELLPGQTRVLPPIDLRERLHTLELRFALASGEPWTRGHLESDRAEDQVEQWASIGPQAVAILASRQPSLDLWVAGRGARPTRFEGVRDGDLLTLPPAPAVLLRLPPDIDLPPPPLGLIAVGRRVRPESVPFEPDEDEDIEEALARDDRTVLFRQPWPGDYELAWFVRNPLTKARFEVQGGEPEVVPVAESASPGIVAPAFVPMGLTRASVLRAVQAALE